MSQNPRRDSQVATVAFPRTGLAVQAMLRAALLLVAVGGFFLVIGRRRKRKEADSRA